ncbi:MAG TPA: asparagine synthase (glutamine-hydrolyzing) [Elusimicrobiota bacterium]|nr:asparagine synthase (glutamine-hydrolyzing) [Elusimicrobiota bacterium]
MCGIAGMWNHRDPALLETMTERLTHRGPDSDGFYHDDVTGLGARRLAVLDLEGGQQPVFNEDKSVVVVYNGEIYNFQSLRADLEKKGHRFQSKTDTEVLVHLYEEKGPDMVRDLNGMFAFALWDRTRQRLIIARDPLGVKPLFYAERPEGLFFSSEIKSLLKVPFIPRDMSYRSLDLYLSYLYIPSPMTIYRHIRKLPPAHLLVCEKGRCSLRRYWDLPRTQRAPLDVSLDRIAHLLEQAVRRQLVSDVPLGIFLSGGMDSSAIALYAARHSPGRLNTFTVGYGGSDSDYNEFEKARLIARQIDSNHHEFTLTPDITDTVRRLAEAFDEPFADSSAVPNFLISRESRQHVTVALTGIGGDELFGGYPRYWGLQWAERIHRWPGVFRRTAPLLARWIPDAGGSINWPGRIRRFLSSADLSPSQQYRRWVTIFHDDLKERLYSDALKDGLKKEILESGGFLPDDGLPDDARLSDRDLKTYLPDDLLCLADRVSMSHSLELRVPFCDLELVDYLSAIPLDMKIRHGQLKYLLKQVLKSSLPSSILDQTKMGFMMPLSRWIREELADLQDDCFDPARIGRRGLFRKGSIDEIRRDHRQGRVNYADHLWALVMLEMWQRKQA